MKKSKTYWDDVNDWELIGSKKEIMKNFNLEGKPDKKVIKAILTVVRYGKRNKVQMWEIQSWLKSNGIEVTPCGVRKHIQHIREHSNEYIKFGTLLANRQGYWVSNDIKEIADYQFTLDKRYRSLALQLLEIAQIKNKINKAGK